MITISCFMQMRNEAAGAGIGPARESIWQYFVSKCANNLHLVMAMSPVGDTLRTRCRNFPGIYIHIYSGEYRIPCSFNQAHSTHKISLVIYFRQPMFPLNFLGSFQPAYDDLRTETVLDCCSALIREWVLFRLNIVQ